MTSERRLVAIMFTDLVGYSALTQQNEALAMELLEQHRSMLRPLFEKHSGREIKTTGDGFLIEFSSPLNAVNCAIEIQGNLHSHNLTAPEERKIDIRIGIHLGEVEERDGDIYGDGVNVAARIEPLAETGGICITDAIYPHVSSKIQLPIESIGTPELKNIQIPVEVYRIQLGWKSISHSSDSETLAQVVDEKSIAVLPFQNMSADPENEYFSDGITEDIIAHLAQIGELKVISRTSSMQYKDASKSIREIGQELGVNNVLEGSVRRAENQVRIVAQLIQTDTDKHLWANTYDRELTNVFEIQSDVAQQIASALKAHVSGEVQAHFEQAPTTSMEAYELYLKGMELGKRVDESFIKQAIEFFERAIALDPQYALAYARLAESHFYLANFIKRPPKELFQKVVQLAEKALELDPNLVDPLISLAKVKALQYWDWSGAEADLRHAIELSPNHAPAYAALGWILECHERFEESLAFYRKTQELDPLSISVRLVICMLYGFQRRFELAIPKFLDIIDEQPELQMTYFYLGVTYLFKQDYQNAIDVLEKLRKFPGNQDDPISLGNLGFCYGKLGNHEKALECLARLLEQFNESYVSPMFISVVYIGIGQHDQAMEWLNKSYELNDDWLRHLSISSHFDELRDHPEFQKLLELIGLPQ
jgi:TolB-like protein/class 3 adenylate cyclase